MSKSKDIRYDRQLRLWGDEGQFSIGQANVCVLGSSGLACEILKNLILAGIKSFTIIDSELVKESDLGNNFFLTSDHIGHHRGSVALTYLKELNPDVKGHFEPFIVNELLIEAMHFPRYSLVIVAGHPENFAISLNQYLFNKNIPFIFARVYGLMGTIFVSVNEQTIYNCHAENILPDLRLDQIFPSLQNVLDNVDLDKMKTEEHSHVPYLILYFKALEKWRQKSNSESVLPFTYNERKDFEKVFMEMRKLDADDNVLDEENFREGRAAIIRSIRLTEIPSEVKELMEHPKAIDPVSDPFWIFIHALRNFVQEHNQLPLSGKLPDMISNTSSYINLLNAYHEKAKLDAFEVFGHILKIVEAKNFDNINISFEFCEALCRDAAYLRMQSGKSMQDAFENSLYKVVNNMLETDLDVQSTSSSTKCSPALWFLLLQSADRFRLEKLRYPGSNNFPIDIEYLDLKDRLRYILEKHGAEDARDENETSNEIVRTNYFGRFDNVAQIMDKIPDNAVKEMCRYGASELHVISALIGGITAQEAIKLITHQYTPLDNLFIFDGHTQMACTFKL